MKILIITQKIDKNDDVLGFMHDWITAFASECDEVTALGLFVGHVALPRNVKTFSLGKERGVSRLSYLTTFYRILFGQRKNYDAVFVHMNPEYVVLGGLFWRILGKRIILWYTHKEINIKLRIATFFAHAICTASPESFRLATPKRHVVGHGILVERFGHIPHVANNDFHILSIGRISRTKGYATLLDALTILRESGKKFSCTLVGGVTTEDDILYQRELQLDLEKRKLDSLVILAGPVPYAATDAYLAHADLFINLSHTGSLDKAVLEAMATRIPVLTSNQGLTSTLHGYEEVALFPEGNSVECARKIRAIMEMTPHARHELGEALRGIVVRDHNLRTLIPRICALM